MKYRGLIAICVCLCVARTSFADPPASPTMIQHSIDETLRRIAPDVMQFKDSLGATLDNRWNTFQSQFSQIYTNPPPSIVFATRDADPSGSYTVSYKVNPNDRQTRQNLLAADGLNVPATSDTFAQVPVVSKPQTSLHTNSLVANFFSGQQDRDYTPSEANIVNGPAYQKLISPYFDPNNPQRDEQWKQLKSVFITQQLSLPLGRQYDPRVNTAIANGEKVVAKTDAVAVRTTDINAQTAIMAAGLLKVPGKDAEQPAAPVGPSKVDETQKKIDAATKPAPPADNPGDATAKAEPSKTDGTKSPTPSDTPAGGDKGSTGDQATAPYNSDTSPFADLNSKATGPETQYQADTYFDYARGALNPSGSTLGTYADSPIYQAAASDIKPLLQDALTAVNGSLNFGQAGAQLGPLRNLLFNKDFQENGAKLLGPENLDMLTNSTLAALAVTNRNLSGDQLNTLSKVFERATGANGPVSTQSALGTLPGKGYKGDFASAFFGKSAGNGEASSTTPSVTASEWIDFAKFISNVSTAPEAKKKYDLDLLNAGRKELDTLVAEMRKFGTAKLFDLVIDNSKLNFYWLHRESMASLVIALRRTAALKLTEAFPVRDREFFGPFMKKEKALLARADKTKSRAGLIELMRKALADADFRRVWKSYLPKEYDRARLATGSMIFSYAFRAAERSRAKPTLASRGFIYIVDMSLTEIKLRNARQKMRAMADKLEAGRRAGSSPDGEALPARKPAARPARTNEDELY